MEPVRLELRSAPLKALIVLVSTACFLFVTIVALRGVKAENLGARDNAEALRQAASLQPDNAERQNSLGRYLLFAEQNPDKASGALLRATELNPYESRYWLDLASVYQVQGDPPAQRNAVARAMAVDPTTPGVLWVAANFYVVEGDIPNALLAFRSVVKNEPDLAAQALAVCWRATGNIDRVLSEVATPTSRQILSLLNLMIEQKQTDAAAKVWDRTLALQEPIAPAKLFPYIDYLISVQDAEKAAQVWTGMTGLDESLKSYQPGDNLISNGSFENKVLNGGFDWRYQMEPGVSLSLDSSTFAAGTRSMVATVNRSELSSFGVSQYVLLKPNTKYEFKGILRAEDLTTASGPRFILRNAYSEKTLMMTKDLLTTNLWSEFSEEFTTGPEDRLAILTVGRDPANNIIQGKVWFDNIALREKR